MLKPILTILGIVLFVACFKYIIAIGIILFLIALYTILNIVEIATGKMSVVTADEAAQAIEKAEKEVQK